MPLDGHAWSASPSISSRSISVSPVRSRKFFELCCFEQGRHSRKVQPATQLRSKRFARCEPPAAKASTPCRNANRLRPAISPPSDGPAARPAIRFGCCCRGWSPDLREQTGRASSARNATVSRLCWFPSIGGRQFRIGCPAIAGCCSEVCHSVRRLLF